MKLIALISILLLFSCAKKDCFCTVVEYEKTGPNDWARINEYTVDGMDCREHGEEIYNYDNTEIKKKINCK